MTICALCHINIDTAPVIAERARHGHASRRVVCPACGLVQVAPRPDATVLSAAPEPIRLHGRDVHPGTAEHTAALIALGHQRGEMVALANLDGAALLFDELQRERDPVSRLRGLEEDAVLVEVPDVDSYTGDREGYHFRREHLYDFSATTLISVLQRACFGDVHVLAREDKLYAWGRSPAMPIVCDDAAGRVRALKATPYAPPVEPGETTLLERFLAGEPIDGEAQSALRSELAGLQAGYASIITAWDDAVSTLSTARTAWERAVRASVETQALDAWLSGASFGRGVAYDQAAKAVSHILHRMGRLSGAFR